MIPNGYYRDNSGNCYVQPAPAVDVCPNLDGTQPVVPLGYTNDSNGNCVAIPPDMCPNIDGPQTTVPEGMVRDDTGACLTPLMPASPQPTITPVEPEKPWVAPSEPRTATTLKNVPEAFQPILQPLVDMVPETVKTALRSLPPVVAQTFPYYIFGVLAASALIMWIQAAHELSAASALLAILRKEKAIAEEKDNFIALASHYLRTPLTVMTTGLDTIKALKELPDDIIQTVRIPILGLEDQIRSILAEIEDNATLHAIESPLKAEDSPSFLRSGFFWWPVISSVLLTLLANFFLGVVGNVELGTVNIWMQVLIGFMVITFFYMAIRNRYIRQKNKAYREQLVLHERTIDQARNTFIERTTAALQNGLNNIGAFRANLNGAHSVRFFDDGYQRFVDILTKFMLLSQIRAGSAVTEETFDLHDAVDAAIARLHDQSEQRKMTIVNKVDHTTITERRALFEFVLGSLLDNAIKFSHEGGTIAISSEPKQKKLTLKVSDYGIGIPEEKIPQLFKPFSRADSALDFNYEGLGFSLFLDKIIMDHMDGDINVTSEVEKGSTFSISTPAHADSKTTKPAAL